MMHDVFLYDKLGSELSKKGRNKFLHAHFKENSVIKSVIFMLSNMKSFAEQDQM